MDLLNLALIFVLWIGLSRRGLFCVILLFEEPFYVLKGMREVFGCEFKEWLAVDKEDDQKEFLRRSFDFL